MFSDSGHSTLRDLNDINDDTEIDSISVQSDRVRRSRRHKKDRDRGRSNMIVDEENEVFILLLEIMLCVQIFL